MNAIGDACKFTMKRKQVVIQLLSVPAR